MIFQKKIFIFITFFLSALFSVAQKGKIANPLRIEYQVSEDDQPLDLVNCKKYGSLMLYASKIDKKDTLLWSFTHLDVNFDLVRETELLLPGDIYFKKAITIDSIVYAAFSCEDRKSDTKLLLLNYNLMSAQYSYMTFDDSKFERFTNIQAAGNSVLASYKTKNNTEQVLAFDFRNHEVKQLITVNESDNSFSRFNILNMTENYSQNGILIFTIKNLSKSNSQILSVYNYTNGYLSTLYNSTLNDSITPVSAAPLFSSTGQLTAIMGGYYKGDLKHIRGNHEFGYKSSGAYSYNLTSNELKTFRIRQSNQDIYFFWNKSTNIDSLNVYGLNGEAYLPVYSTVSDIDYDYWGRPYSTQRLVLNGFSSFQIFNFIFDNNGNLIKHNVSEIENILSTRPLQRSISIFNRDEIVNISYSFDYIQYNIFETATRKSSYDRFYPQKRYKKDVVMQDINTLVEHWYDNYFLVYGYQVVKNNSIIGKNRRYVFFMQKVGLGEE